MRKNNCGSKTALVVGAVFTFLGFIWPGWLWVLSTPGDVEMMTMAVMTAVGIIGLVVFGVGVLGFVKQRRSEKGEIEGGGIPQKRMPAEGESGKPRQ
ncbi:MAG: hypothetical protein LCH63_16455 [Candidatus Melainabacteria bacterium]|nr:hypothetical protein [Candidatus Melainabacteria bacterium]